LGWLEPTCGRQAGEVIIISDNKIVSTMVRTICLGLTESRRVVLTIIHNFPLDPTMGSLI